MHYYLERTVWQFWDKEMNLCFICYTRHFGDIIMQEYYREKAGKKSNDWWGIKGLPAAAALDYLNILGLGRDNSFINDTFCALRWTLTQGALDWISIHVVFLTGSTLLSFWYSKVTVRKSVSEKDGWVNVCNCFKHTITKPLCLSCRFAQIPAQFGSILCYLSCLFMFLLPCSIVSSAEFSAKLFFRRQNDDVGRRRSERRRLFLEIIRLTRIFL